MKNKFEALTAFQSWPADWQFLCAEYWAASAMRNGVKPAPLEMQATAVDESSATTAKPPRECFTVGRYTPRQEEYLVKCCHETRRKNGKSHRKRAALRFLAMYPGRQVEAVMEKARTLENRNWKINY